MGEPHLAQLNVGRLIAPKGAPEVEEFYAAIDRVNGIAERMPGFVWRFVDGDETGAPHPALAELEDPRFIVNLSIWSSVHGFKDFVFKTVHARIMDRREAWFEPHGRASFVMWFVEAGARPNLAAAFERLAELRRDGPSPRAFGWAELDAMAAEPVLG